MAHAVNFDTLAYANKLKQAGVPDKQAEAQSEALAEIFDDQAATKKDLQDVEKMIRKDLQDVEKMIRKDLQNVETKLTTKMDSKISEVEVKIAEIKAEIIKWVVGLFFAQSALIISFLKFFR